MKAFAVLGANVSYDIPDDRSFDGEVRFYADGRIEASFQADVNAASMAHELGHVIDDALYRCDPSAGGYMFTTTRLLDDPRLEDIQAECKLIARETYSDEADKLAYLEYKSKGWGLSSWIAAYKARDQRRFLDDYAGSLEEGFANTFSLLMMSPNEAKEIAPNLVAVIEEQMNKHPDLKKLLNDYQSLHKPQKKS